MGGKNGQKHLFRSLIFTGNSEEIYKLLKMIPEWTFKEKNISGINQKYIENIDKNVKVLFDDKMGFHSVNVLPINPNVGDIYNKYEDGYDMSENQKKDIKDDILYSLCILINNTINEYNENIKDSEDCINVLCGIIPSKFDCNQAQKNNIKNKETL